MRKSGVISIFLSLLLLFNSMVLAAEADVYAADHIYAEEESPSNHLHGSFNEYDYKNPSGSALTIFSEESEPVLSVLDEFHGDYTLEDQGRGADTLTN